LRSSPNPLIDDKDSRGHPLKGPLSIKKVLHGKKKGVSC
jgi:hypothetical protein